MVYICGQEHAKKALEVAAAGSHEILLNEPHGADKTLLAKSFPDVLFWGELPEFGFNLIEVPRIEFEKLTSYSSNSPTDARLQ